ncbi:hypothetical protein LIER_41691 [Lithospermum erythrorhizon]|uniref:Uncharacterized protein n=1 Tax=Lithospermum erythrorhizon TaxID=34254 RepID=A0AAV3RE65_LITER
MMTWSKREERASCVALFGVGLGDRRPTRACKEKEEGMKRGRPTSLPCGLHPLAGRRHPPNGAPGTSHVGKRCFL